MTSNGNDSEFVSGHEIKLTLSLTPEQAMAMQAWSDAIPTMYMLDICVVNATKLSEWALANDARKAALVRHLRHLDRPQNSFSYLLALIEKVSDPRVSRKWFTLAIPYFRLLSVGLEVPRARGAVHRAGLSASRLPGGLAHRRCRPAG